jgi:hypothetical protein
MISIETINIEQKDNLAIYNLNYPILNSDGTIPEGGY